jgi:hypothetical protein
MALKRSLKEELDTAAGLLCAEEPRCDHARVVEHEQIARPQEPGQISHHEILVASAPSIKREESTCGSLGKRCLSHPIGWDLIREVAKLHAVMLRYYYCLQKPEWRNW